MNFDDVSRIIKYHDELNDSLAIDVKISRNEAERIAVESLIKKYKACNDTFSANLIKHVLLNWYLTKHDFRKLIGE